jgi:hypothetical protein
MRRPALRIAEAVLLPTAALAVTLVLAPGRAEVAVHVYVLVLLAAGLALTVAAISAAHAGGPPSGFDHALRRRHPRPERLPELARLEREAALAQSSAFDLHYRLRPVLREVAAGLLAWRHGIDLDRDRDRASELLGSETWQLVRPDRPPPHDRLGRGIDADALNRVVASLEAL